MMRRPCGAQNTKSPSLTKSSNALCSIIFLCEVTNWVVNVHGLIYSLDINIKLDVDMDNTRLIDINNDIKILLNRKIYLLDKSLHALENTVAQRCFFIDVFLENYEKNSEVLSEKKGAELVGCAPCLQERQQYIP